MAEPALDQEADDLLDPQESTDVAAKRKRLKIIAAVVAVLLLIAGGLGYYFLVMEHGDGKQEAAILGACPGAHCVRNIAPAYGIPAIVHSDHCATKLLPWFDGMLDAGCRRLTAVLWLMDAG